MYTRESARLLLVFSKVCISSTVYCNRWKWPWNIRQISFGFFSSAGGAFFEISCLYSLYFLLTEAFVMAVCWGPDIDVDGCWRMLTRLGRRDFSELTAGWNAKTSATWFPPSYQNLSNLTTSMSDLRYRYCSGSFLGPNAMVCSRFPRSWWVGSVRYVLEMQVIANRSRFLRQKRPWC